MPKQHGWEFKKCGRGTGGANEKELGTCPGEAFKNLDAGGVRKTAEKDALHDYDAFYLPEYSKCEGLQPIDVALQLEDKLPSTEEQPAATEQASRSTMNSTDFSRSIAAKAVQIKFSAGSLARIALDLKKKTAWYRA